MIGLEQRARIKAKLPAARMLEDSLFLVEDKLHLRVSAVAKSAESRATANDMPELLSIYAQCREYRSAAAKKAVKTRRKKAAAQAAAAQAAAEEAVEPIGQDTTEAE